MHQESSPKSPVTFLSLVLLIVGMLCLCCTMKGSRTREIIGDLKPQILEFDNVIQYRLDLNPKTKVPEKVSGTCFRSSFCVRDIMTKTNKSTLVVLVTIGFCQEGQSGSFSYPLKVGDDITELRFGNNEHLLWRREQPQ